MPRANSANHLSRSSVALALTVWYAACFLLLPVWVLAPELGSQLAWLAMLLLAGTVWVALAAGPVDLPDWRGVLLAWAGAFLFALAWHGKHLTSGIPWKGDEDYHIVATLQYLEIFRKPVLLAFPAAVIALFLLQRLRPGLGWVAAGPFLFLCLYLATKFPEDPVMLLRYPGINRLLSMPGLVLADWLGHYPPEWLFRLAPFTAAAGIAAFVAWWAKDAPLLLRYLLVPLVMSIPVMGFYATILYLELPMVLLMTVAFFYGKELLTRAPEDLRRHPAWYALILTGFLRESALPFLAAFLAARFLVRLRTAGRLPAWRWWWGEAACGVVVLLPLALQLALGAQYEIARSYTPDWSNLLNAGIVRSVLASYGESFGFMLIPCAAGLVVMFRRGEGNMLLWLAGTALLNFAFWTADSLAFWGHSRFNLLLLPALLYPTTVALKALAARRPIQAYLAVLTLVAANYWISPLQSDGTKQNLWGVYYTDAEYYYPYREALRWLSEEMPEGRLLMGGMDYDYDYRYYQTRFGGPAHIEFRPLTSLTEAVATAAREGFDALLFQVTDNQSSLPPGDAATADTTFRNRAGELRIFLVPR